MANNGYSMTPAGLYKLTQNTGDWSNSQRLICTQAAAIAELSDNEANAAFIAMLNTLGVSTVRTVRVCDKKVEVFIFSSSDVPESAEMSDQDKRQAIADATMQGIPGAVDQLAALSGAILDAMYKSSVKVEKPALPYCLYRFMVESHTIHRITNQPEDVDMIVRNAIKLLCDSKRIDNEKWRKYAAA